MKALLIRREKARPTREVLISAKIEFYEETKNFHTAFIFPGVRPDVYLPGKWVDLLDENEVSSVEIKGMTFRIDASRDVIDIFAPKFIAKGLKVKLENPDAILEIHRWGNKYVVSVS